MTRDEIKQLAQDAGFLVIDKSSPPDMGGGG